VTISPWFIRDLHSCCVSGKLATVPLWPRPRVVTARRLRTGYARLTWELGQGLEATVAMGCNATQVNSKVFLFSFGLIQIKSNSILN
jgi:hypothetical protein